MATANPRIILSRSQDIPFNKLVLSQANDARRASRSKTSPRTLPTERCCRACVCGRSAMRMAPRGTCSRCQRADAAIVRSSCWCGRSAWRRPSLCRASFAPTGSPRKTVLPRTCSTRRFTRSTWTAHVVGAEVPPLSPGEAWRALLDGDVRLDLVEGMQLRRVTVMSAVRAELTGFTDGMVDRLKAMGLISEIIAWRLRLFVPTGEDRGPAILASILDRHPLIGTRDRAAA